MGKVKWIKVSIDMFDDEKIKLIDAMDECDSIHYVWLRLLIQAGKTNSGGDIFLNENIPYTKKMLSIIFNRPLNLIELSLNVLCDLKMIEVDENNFINILNWEKHQNVEGMEKIREQTRSRVQKHRMKKKLIESKISFSDEDKIENSNENITEDVSENVIEGIMENVIEDKLQNDIIKDNDYIKVKDDDYVIDNDYIKDDDYLIDDVITIKDNNNLEDNVFPNCNVTVTHQNKREKETKNENKNKKENNKVSKKYGKSKNRSEKDNSVKYEKKIIGKCEQGIINTNETMEDVQLKEIMLYIDKLPMKIIGANASTIKTAISTYGDGNVRLAIEKSLEVNKFKMSYINGILKNLKSESGYVKNYENLNDNNYIGYHKKQKVLAFNDFEPRHYDYNALEKALLGW